MDNENDERAAILLAVYNKKPITVISQALADLTGLPMHAPIPLEMVERLGGSVSGLRSIVNDTLDAARTLRGDAAILRIVPSASTDAEQVRP